MFLPSWAVLVFAVAILVCLLLYGLLVGLTWLSIPFVWAWEQVSPKHRQRRAQEQRAHQARLIEARRERVIRDSIWSASKLFGGSDLAAWVDAFKVQAMAWYATHPGEHELPEGFTEDLTLRMQRNRDERKRQRETRDR